MRLQRVQDANRTGKRYTTLKTYVSPLTIWEEEFTLLPEQQRITEEALIELEQKIARSIRKNEDVLSQSEEIAARTTLG